MHTTTVQDPEPSTIHMQGPPDKRRPQDRRDRRPSIRVRSLPGGVVIALTGDHDLSTKPELVRALAGTRNEGRVVIDLQRCTFVDSTIIGAIISALRPGDAAQLNISLVLPDDTSYVCRALTVIGLRQLVPAHLSVEAALGVSPEARDQVAGPTSDQARDEDDDDAADRRPPAEGSRHGNGGSGA